MGRHDKTLDILMELPSRSDVRWAAFVALIENKGGTVAAGAGSRFRLSLKGARAVMHRPHPGEQMSKAQASSARDFLIAAGLKPGAATPDPPPEAAAELIEEARPARKPTKEGGPS